MGFFLGGDVEVFRKTADKINDFNKISVYKIKLRKKNDFGFSVYLSFRRDGKNERFSLRNHFINGTKSLYRDDKQTLLQIHQKQLEYDKMYKLRNSPDSVRYLEYQKADFISYLESKSENYKYNTKKTWNKCIIHLKRFSKSDKIKFNEIDRQFCNEFHKYLRLTAKLKTNSVSTYFQKFKQALEMAMQEEIILKNPASHIKLKRESTERVTLDENEIDRIWKSDFYDERLKNAFIFSCYTGLRFSDYTNITYEDIQDDVLITKQIKTEIPVIIPLLPIPKQIIERQKIINKSSTGKIFTLPTYSVCLRKLKKLASFNNIEKNISSHTGRHTFATTICINNDLDYFVTSKILGHTSIRSTQIYTKAEIGKLVKSMKELNHKL